METPSNSNVEIPSNTRNIRITGLPRKDKELYRLIGATEQGDGAFVRLSSDSFSIFCQGMHPIFLGSIQSTLNQLSFENPMMEVLCS